MSHGRGNQQARMSDVSISGLACEYKVTQILTQVLTQVLTQGKKFLEVYVLRCCSGHGSSAIWIGRDWCQQGSWNGQCHVPALHRGFRESHWFCQLYQVHTWLGLCHLAMFFCFGLHDEAFIMFFFCIYRITRAKRIFPIESVGSAAGRGSRTIRMTNFPAGWQTLAEAGWNHTFCSNLYFEYPQLSKQHLGRMQLLYVLVSFEFDLPDFFNFTRVML